MLDLKSLYTIDLTNNKGETEITKCKLVNYSEDTDLYTVSPYGIGTVIENIEEDQLTSIEEDWHEITKTGKSLTITAQQGTPIALKVIIPFEQPGSGDPSVNNIRPITYTNGSELTVNGQSYTVSFGKDGYGKDYQVVKGSFDCISGILDAEIDQISLSENTIINNHVSGLQNQAMFRLPDPTKNHQGIDYALASSAADYPDYSSHTINKNVQGEEGFYISMLSTSSYGETRMNFRLNGYTGSTGTVTLEALKTYLRGQITAGTPVQFTYHRTASAGEDKYSISGERYKQLTPIGITLQEGTNTLSTDVGEIEITYMGKE